jgi:hypothetical protein
MCFFVSASVVTPLLSTQLQPDNTVDEGTEVPLLLKVGSLPSFNVIVEVVVNALWGLFDFLTHDFLPAGISSFHVDLAGTRPMRQAKVIKATT